MRSFHVPASEALASEALVEMLAQDGELDRILDGRGLVFDNPPPPPVHAPAPFDIPAADWDEEERERAAVEREHVRQQRATIVAEELAKLEQAEPPRQPTPPAPRRKRLRIHSSQDAQR